MSPRIVYNAELKELDSLVESMCIQTEDVYCRLFYSMRKKDEEMVRMVLGNESTIRNMECRIEEKCLSLITKQQPVADDLRRISAALKAVTDLQRIGNHVVDIAELIIRLKMTELELFSSHLNKMIEETGKMIKCANEAFLQRNIEMAEMVMKRDDVVDDLFSKVKADLVEKLKQGYPDEDACVDVLMITKYLEKIGDHAVNIGEWTIFKDTGKLPMKVDFT